MVAQNVDPGQLKAFTNVPEQTNPGPGHKLLIDVDGSAKVIDWDQLPSVDFDLDGIFAPRREQFTATEGQVSFGPLPLRVASAANVLVFVEGVNTQAFTITQSGSDSYAVLDFAPGAGAAVQTWCINPAWTQVFSRNNDFTLTDQFYGASITVDNSERDITITLSDATESESALGPFARLRVMSAGPYWVKVVASAGQMRSNPNVTSWDTDRDELFLGYSFDLQDEAQIEIDRWSANFWSVKGPARAAADDLNGIGGASSGHIIQEDAVDLTARARLNFGTGLTATDDSGNSRTNVVLGSHQHTLADVTDAGGLAALDAIAVSAASKLLGRGDSGAGDHEEITLGAGLSMSGTTLSAAGAGLPADDTTEIVQDPVDNTKRMRIDVGAVATTTTRVVTVPDQDVDLTPTTGTFLGSANDTVTNAKLADMAQATFKMRAAAAGTGDPIDGTAAQAKTALAIAQADIVDDVPLAKIADIASPTVLANVSGSTAAPIAVDPATFKTEFGFGTLGSQDNITVSDISAGGTPSATTFLRGDGSWAGIVASVTYEVLDIDDATTLTAAHSRYQIAAGGLKVLKLRLRNASDQTDPVTVTMPDTDAVTGAGNEFDFIVADDQTGVCTIERETNGTINGATSVALAGARATAVLIIDANAGTAPNARLEGETDETRTVAGDTTFSDAVTVSGTFSIPGGFTLGGALTLDTGASIVGGGKVASDLELVDTAETYLDAGNKSGAASFVYSAAAWQKCVATANITSMAITSPPATGRVGTITLEIHQDGSGGKTIAWGAAFRFPGGTDFTLSTAAGAIDIFVLSTRDGGTTWYVAEAGKAFAA